MTAWNGGLHDSPLVIRCPLASVWLGARAVRQCGSQPREKHDFTAQVGCVSSSDPRRIERCRKTHDAYFLPTYYIIYILQLKDADRLPPRRAVQFAALPPDHSHVQPPNVHWLDCWLSAAAAWRGLPDDSRGCEADRLGPNISYNARWHTVRVPNWLLR